MLFNSYSFIFVFLPLAIMLFFIVSRYGGQQLALSWLILCSLYFYISWDVTYWWVIAATTIVNYAIGRGLLQTGSPHIRTSLLRIGVLANIVFLAWFKLRISGLPWFNADGREMALLFDNTRDLYIPLAISFITFQQIVYLVDCYKRNCSSTRFTEYLLFISFFPQLVMGPIVHQREIVPQFRDKHFYRFNIQNFSIGLSIFIIGLFKKTVLADNLADSINLIYQVAASGTPINLVDAWIATIGFIFQLYFDFSGYSDMAIGIAKMLNINLPINFDSPLKAANRFEYWRRWHITFSEFMKNNVYMPLARNRSIPLGKYTALLVSTTLSGLWHGIGFTFLAWGLIQGAMMIAGHKAREYRRGNSRITPATINVRPCLVIITLFTTFMLGILFRSGNHETAVNMFSGIMGFNGVVIPSIISSHITGIHIAGDATLSTATLLAKSSDVTWLIACFVVIFIFPSTKNYFGKYWSALDQRKHGHAGSNVRINHRGSGFEFNYTTSLIISVMLILSLYSILESSRFIYYQF